MSSRWIISARPGHAEHALDLARVAADEPRRMAGVIGHEAAPDLAPGRLLRCARNRRARRRRRPASRPAGSRLAPPAQRPCRAGIDRQRRRAARASRRSTPCGPRRGRLAPSVNQVQRPPSAMRAHRIADAAVGDHHVGAAGRGDLAGLDLGAHAAARQFGGRRRPPWPRWRRRCAARAGIRVAPGLPAGGAV